jgi:xanthine dehydrogenase iron-sulfur cluster and FAD-binding subunit A
VQQRAVQIVPTSQVVQQVPKSTQMQAVKGDQNVKNDVTDDKFFFFLNEKKITLDSVDPTMTLNDFIRGQRTFKSLYF